MKSETDIMTRSLSYCPLPLTETGCTFMGMSPVNVIMATDYVCGSNHLIHNKACQ